MNNPGFSTDHFLPFLCAFAVLCELCVERRRYTQRTADVAMPLQNFSNLIRMGSVCLSEDQSYRILSEGIITAVVIYLVTRIIRAPAYLSIKREDTRKFT